MQNACYSSQIRLNFCKVNYQLSGVGLVLRQGLNRLQFAKFETLDFKMSCI